MKKIGIFGIGCIGSVLIRYLNQNPNNKFYYYNRSVIEKIDIIHDSHLISLPIRLTKKNTAKLDWLIVCLKEYHISDALTDIKALITQKTKLCIFQNGVDIAHPYLAITHLENILETTIDCPTQKNKANQIIQFRKPLIQLPESKIAKDFKLLFQNTQLTPNLTAEFKIEQWKKLIESSSIGAIQSFYKQDCSIFEKKAVVDEYKLLINEGIDVAMSKGMDIDHDYMDYLINKLSSYAPNKASSMLSDTLAGRPLELGAKIGAIYKSAMVNNIKIPTTKRFYDKLTSLR